MKRGVKVIAETKGHGVEATRGHTVTIRYSLSLNRGDIVQATQEETFTIGKRNIIAGLEYGVDGMQVGGRRTIRISPHLAYRDDGIPDMIPKNAVLNFEIELLAID